MSAHTPSTPPDQPAVVAWLAAHPEGLDPDRLADVATSAAVVGLGESTREGHEVFRFVEDATRALIERGFGVIALWENPRVTDLFDRYVTGGDVDVDQALRQAWGPFQTAEMRQALTGLRDLNRDRQDPVRILGVGQDRVLVADYDRAVELLEGLDPVAAASVKERLDVIRVAHHHGEHVLRAHGQHPGTPFVEVARDARSTAARLDPGAERDEALDLLDAVVAFHANPMAPGADLGEAAREAAHRLLDHHAPGHRVVLWEGIAHVAGHPGPLLGARLRESLGRRYVSVLITFGRGRITTMDVPPPRLDALEAVFAEAGGARVVDLRAPAPPEVAAALSRAWPTRVISGVYRAEEDHEHYLDLAPLTDGVDAVAFLPSITSTHSLDVGVPR